MSRSIWQFVHRSRLLFVMALVVGIIAVQPTLLAPLGRAYIVFCERFLAGVSFGHHYPPLLVAFILLGAMTLTFGLFIAVAQQIMSERHLMRELSKRRQRELGFAIRQVVAAVGAEGRVVITADHAVYAFCAGLLRPRVYMSQGLLDLLSMDEIEAVLRHEWHHVSRYDPLRLFVGSLLGRLAGLIPILATIENKIRVNVELGADRAALRTIEIDALAAALLKVARSPDSGVSSHAMVASLSPTEARIAALVGRPVSVRFNWREIVISIGVTSSLVAFAIWLSLQPITSPPACSVCPPF